MARIVNLKHEPDAVANGAVRVDRRTRWGNPYVLGKDGSREQVVARYRADLWRRIRAGDIALADLAALDSSDPRVSLPSEAVSRARARTRRGLGAASVLKAARRSEASGGRTARRVEGVPPRRHHATGSESHESRHVQAHHAGGVAHLRRTADYIGDVYAHDDILNRVSTTS